MKEFPTFYYKENVQFKNAILDEPVSIVICQYAINNRVAIELLDVDSMPFMDASVNLRDCHCAVNEVFIKAHDENLGIVGFLIANEVIVEDSAPPLYRYNYNTYPKFQLHPKLAAEIASRCV